MSQNELNNNLNSSPKEPDATEHEGCFTCERPQCSCGNNEEYIKKLVECITKEVLSRLGN